MLKIVGVTIAILACYIVTSKLFSNLFFKLRLYQADLDSYFIDDEKLLLAYVEVNRSEKKENFKQPRFFDLIFYVNKKFKASIYSQEKDIKELYWVHVSKCIFLPLYSQNRVLFIKNESQL